jgi:hypothetical protein
MSELKKTPLMKFLNLIKGNEECFEDKAFLDFLLQEGHSLLTKEKKSIVKAFDKGFKYCVEINKEDDDFGNEDYGVSFGRDFGDEYFDNKYLQSNIEYKKLNQSEIDEEKKSLLEMFKDFNVLDIIEPASPVASKTENDIKLENFCKTLSENPISINENSEVSKQKQIEEILIKKLQEVGIEPKSVQIIKL